MRLRIGLGLLGTLLAAGVAVAQTAPSPTTSPSTAPQSQTTSPAAATTSSTGAFSSLSPGNQKIVQALCAAQKNGCGGTGSLTPDQIAAMKPKGEGWGEFFRQHRDLFPGSKNLGEAVSNFERSQKSSSTTSESASATGKEKSKGVSSKGRSDEESSGGFGGQGGVSGHGGVGGRVGGRR